MTPEPAPTTEAPADAAATTETAAGLTADDRAALAAVVAKERAAARSEAKKARDAQAELDKLREASQTETEKAIAQARKEAADEASKGYRSKILNAEIRAQAAGKFANPKLAAKLLDLDPDEVFGDDGDPDTSLIVKQIDEFLKLDENAGLRASGNGARPSGDADAGKGSSGAAVGDMNEFIRAGINKRT